MSRAIVALAFAVACGDRIAEAGELEPPGPPGTTMVTLQAIFDELDSLSPIQRTGQTLCTTEHGSVTACAGSGQDGEYRTGASVEPRFTDNANGTVTDNLTGLIWLQDADCFGLRSWTLALSDANTLADGACGLSDGSQPGDWRLPNVKEAISLIDYGQYIPALPDDHPFVNVPPAPPNVNTAPNWSSTSFQRLPGFNEGHARTVHHNGGYVGVSLKSEAHYLWPVRGGR